ncbi:hypothetical protein MOO46_07610 (plasmid) [Apilactobacillus apisilvae]|uniref:Uncharacterized protein n=1 Tax=Apilactobacillus apisilvae TaxID=2923364 RepID=A0ABY4PKG6_9LACO|nr:hypothetical protein [Apilactobacillus apisilvae]UQS85851.1 hypothetical protein MOO46_07610 [Apilactobacillus apisilvae]
MNLYKHKPKIVNAFKWDGFQNTLTKNVNRMELKSFSVNGNHNLTIHTDQGSMLCAIGDYVIQNGINDYYCCKHIDFRNNYSLVDKG